MLVSELLAKRPKREVISTGVDSNVLDVARQLRGHEISAILICDEHKNVKGLISERDLVQAIVNYPSEVGRIPVQEIMTTKLISCRPQDSILETLDIMNKHHIRHMLVLDDGKPTAMLSIREFDYALKSLQKDAHTDELTGLNNRRYFSELFEKEFERYKRFGAPLSVAMLDIDKFKSINDKYGHQGGDQVLASLAKLLLGELRAYDVVGRLGGEEFAIIFPNTSIHDARLACYRLMSAIRGYVVATDQGPVSFTASLGLICATPQAKSSSSLLHHADKLLYEAKATGRNRLVIDADQLANSMPVKKEA
ncbi:MAG: GGDEF domain-containing protein [Pseudomonadota bacterium]